MKFTSNILCPQLVVNLNNYNTKTPTVEMIAGVFLLLVRLI